MIFCIAQALITLIWTFLGIRIHSPGFAMASIPDWINPEAPLTPKKHPFELNFSASNFCDWKTNPFLDNGVPISGYSGKSHNPGVSLNKFINFFGKALPLLWAGKNSDLKNFLVRKDEILIKYY